MEKTLVIGMATCMAKQSQNYWKNKIVYNQCGWKAMWVTYIWRSLIAGLPFLVVVY